MVLFIRSSVLHDFLYGEASRGFGFSACERGLLQGMQSIQTVGADLSSCQMVCLGPERAMATLT